MTSDQTGARANEQGEAAEELCLLLRAEDGTTYAIPQAALAGYRLADAQRAALEARLGADGTDVQGYYYPASWRIWISAELNMFQRQNMVSQRGVMLQLTQGTMESMNDAAHAIAPNIGR